MVRKLECECAERYEAKLDTWKLYQEIKDFFKSQAENGVYEDIPVSKPYFIGHSNTESLSWFADKWYRCRNCGCLWELTYPDFPANGFVRKFPNGVYKERGY